jgi:hypothetical protein
MQQGYEKRLARDSMLSYSAICFREYQICNASTHRKFEHLV